MKKLILTIIILFNTLIYSQEKNKILSYMNMSSFSLTKNTESYFNSYTENNQKETNGASFEINTIHGIKLFEFIALSGGISIDWNINKTFLSNPFIVDLRVFSNKSNKPCFFAYIQTGKNIKWSDSFDGNGTTSKLGIGFIFVENNKTLLYIDAFKKSKQIQTSEFQHKGYYNTDGFGLSLGIIFK